MFCLALAGCRGGPPAPERKPTAAEAVAAAGVPILSGRPVVPARRTNVTIVPPAPRPPENAALIALGKKIFFDERLSEPAGTSCASCHDPKRAFSGTHGSSIGVPRGSRPDHFARRSTPSVLYLRFVPRFHYFEDDEAAAPAPFGGFFWDGRADSLAELVRQPLFNPDEMNAGNPRRLASKIASAPYAREFRAFVPSSEPEAVMRGIGAALEAFLVSDEMTPATSKYDAYVRGQATLTAQEVRGFEAFKDRARGGCSGCHRLNETSTYPERSMFTDYGFDAVAVPRNRELPGNGNPTAFDLGLCERKNQRTPSDDEKLCGSFRTPSLRNVAVREAFMHNGRFRKLRDVVAFYAKRATAPAEVYAPGREVRRSAGAAARQRQHLLDAVQPPRRQPAAHLRRGHRRHRGLPGDLDRRGLGPRGQGLVSRRTQRPRGSVIALGLLAWLTAAPAFAHSVGLSNGDYRLDGQMLNADLSLSQRELVMLLPEIDADHDGILDPEELSIANAALTRGVVGGLTVVADGGPCPGTLDRAWLLEGENGLVVRARYACPRAIRQLSLSWPIFAGLAPDHRQVARLFAGGRSQSTVLDRAHAAWTIDLAGGGAGGAGVAWSMLKLGVEHILTGADHLVFLLGLIIVGGRWRSLAGVVTAFTAAHSITLALATLGVLTPSPRLVEPAIALSIAYVGVENFFVEDVSRRWRITFPFGLIHGFGFAGALREIALPHAQVVTALVSFNVGVELGQLGVLAIALPLTAAARRAPRFGERGVLAVSSTIAVVGVVLFVVRVMAT